MAKFYYAVKKGKNPGVYETWDECKAQVIGVSGSIYKKFSTLDEAEKFIDGYDLKDDEIDSQYLTVCSDDELIAYVDGSYNIEDKSFSYGAILFNKCVKEEYSQRFLEPELSEMRNVAGEIKGAEKAMERAVELGVNRLFLHYDYAGIEHWALGNWKANKKGTQAYRDFYNNIKDELDVVFIKVKAHSGIEYNEIADKLAKDAVLEKI